MVISMSICKVEECTDKSHSLGYCQKHLLRYKKYNDPLYTKTEMHGMTKTPEYRVWHNMKSRCLYPNDKAYKHYGGRNITVCDRWLHSFIAFYDDMGPKPFPKAEIDRICTEGNYEPGNCEWVTGLVNRRHTRATKITLKIAREIREKAKRGIRYIDMSKEYNITSSGISNIIANRTWKE